MDREPGILFTAFEPSGDEHAAAVIAELRRLAPGVPIWALGGPRMAEHGAELIEPTTAEPAMLGGALGKVREHRRLRRRLSRWLAEHPIAVHVPTDSPAANWAICRMVKGRGGARRTKVVHLIAPQVWAWAPWRIRRLRRLSDLVLCVLPFEPEWFERRGVRARFIGHPLFDGPLDTDDWKDGELAEVHGWPKLALLPGSRPGEIRANWPLMADAFDRLARRFYRIEGVVAAADDHAAELIGSTPGSVGSASGGGQDARATPGSVGSTSGGVPPAKTSGGGGGGGPRSRKLRIVVGRTDTVLGWADAALCVSGTATLRVARHLKPMVIVYRAGRLSWHLLGRWLIDTRTFTLPNLIAAGGPDADRRRHIVREFVPWLSDDAGPIAEELTALVENVEKRQQQLDALRRVVRMFEGRHAGQEAARAILEVAKW